MFGSDEFMTIILHMYGITAYQQRKPNRVKRWFDYIDLVANNIATKMTFVI
jgi:hypothetical protein